MEIPLICSQIRPCRLETDFKLHIRDVDVGARVRDEESSHVPKPSSHHFIRHRIRPRTSTSYIDIQCSIATSKLSIRRIRPLANPRRCFGECEADSTGSIAGVGEGGDTANFYTEIENNIRSIPAEDHESRVTCWMTVSNSDD